MRAKQKSQPQQLNEDETKEKFPAFYLEFSKFIILI